ncbi:MAG TPA: hypothetical protein VF035_04155 [Longimicrobiales bacterium]
MRTRLFLCILAAAAFAGCESSGGNVIDLDDTTGVARGIAYLDADGDGLLDLRFDSPVVGVVAAVVRDGTADTVGSATTDNVGAFIIPDIPVGRYRLVANSSAAGDSIAVLGIDNATFTLAVGDTVVRQIRLGYPVITVTAAEQAVLGRRVSVEGLALNGWSVFGDSTLHIIDNTGALRAVRVAPSAVAQGDSVRLLGTIGTNNGRPALVDATVRVLSGGRVLPAIDSITTAAAATAAAGARANGQARVAGVIMDTTRAGADRVITVNDGSGSVDVVLDANVTFDPAVYTPGATLRASGILVPRAAGGWNLKPRDRAEVQLTFVTLTVAQVRASELGRRVFLDGIALTRWNAFGDSTLHVQDATGALRSVRVTGAALAGDSVRLVGTVAVRNGQPVLTSVNASVLRPDVGLPAPDSVSTATAANAAGGTRDAGQVLISGTIQGSETAPGGDLILATDDGSGRVDVVVAAGTGLGAGSYVPGALLRASGVLVPTGGGTWRLYSRGPSDLFATFPTVTIAEARALAPGKTVFVHGIALNGWSTFGDSTVHLAGGGSSIRITRLPSSAIFTGDSIRVLGTVGIRNGQPVLLGTSHAVLRSGAGLPALDSVSTMTATLADGGSRDAGQVRVAGRITNVQTLPTGETQLGINDGSGALTVILDADVGFTGSAYQIGAMANLRGVLVPYATGTFWHLKPRTLAELVITAAPSPPVFFRTTWREYVSGQMPAGWTTRWDRSNLFFVVDDAASLEGRLLQWSSAVPNTRPREQRAFAYDGFADIADQEVYTEFRVRALNDTSLNQIVGAAAVRISGTAADEGGYQLAFEQRANGTRGIVLATFVAGVYTELDTFDFTWTEDTWYSVRLEAVGTTVRGRVWARGTAEPAAWTVEGPGDRYASGRPGLATQDAATIQWAVFEARVR